jgi:triosephosphate isomerase
MRKKIVIGNWKMYTTANEAKMLASAIVKGVKINGSNKVVICPPFPYLNIVGKEIEGTSIALGAQNIFPEQEGAFTGEVSPVMLVDLGCEFVILGHSERRESLGESDTFINKKVLAALDAGLNVIFCIGETLEQRNSKLTQQILNQQLTLGLAGLTEDLMAQLIVAYEPVWAIGVLGHQATPKQAHEEHTVIRSFFGEMFGNKNAEALCIIYGGSVNPRNAKALFQQDNVDGVLIGAGSLNAKEFLAIVHSSMKIDTHQ